MEALKNYTGVYVYVATSRRFKGKPDKCYYVKFKVDGKSYERKVGWASEGKTPQIAQVERGRMIDDLRQGKAPVSKITLEGVWEKYLPYARGNIKPPTLKLYESLWGNIPNSIRKTQLVHLDEYKLQLMATDLRNSRRGSTVALHLRLVSLLTQKAIDWKLFHGTNPVRAVKKEKTNGRKRYLTTQEAKDLLQALEKRSLVAKEMALLALHTGMRRGEILSLQFKDLHMEKEEIHVDASKTKTSKGRTVYMTPEVKALLQSKKGEGEDFVFASPSGRKRGALPKSFADTVKELGLDNVCFHTLRHTFASWLALNGESLYWIKELLGHSSITQTEAYAHLLPADTKKALRSLPRL